MSKKNTHSKLINDLAKRLEDSLSHDYILNKEIFYGVGPTQVAGEMDLLATHDRNKYRLILK